MANRHLLAERVCSTAARLERESRGPLSTAWNIREGKPIHRKAAIAALVATMRFPGIRKALPSLLVGGRPQEVDAHLDHGTEQVVYRSLGDPNTVIKIGLGKATRSYERARSIAEAQQDKVDLVTRYMGEYAVRSEFYPAKIQVIGGTIWTVSSTQRYLPNTVNVFEGTTINHGAIDELNSRGQTTDFYSRAKALRLEQGLFIDPIGEGNLVVADGQLALIDNIPRTLEEVAKPWQPPRYDGQTIGDEIRIRLDQLYECSV